MNIGLKIVRDRGEYKVMNGDCSECFLSTNELQEAQAYIANNDIKAAFSVKLTKSVKYLSGAEYLLERTKKNVTFRRAPKPEEQPI